MEKTRGGIFLLGIVELITIIVVIFKYDGKRIGDIYLSELLITIILVELIITGIIVAIIIALVVIAAALS